MVKWYLHYVDCHMEGIGINTPPYLDIQCN